MRHEVKIADVYYDAIVEGHKNFEIRYNDRGYQRGDELIFFNGTLERLGLWKISYVHSGLGMADGFVVLGIEKVTAPT